MIAHVQETEMFVPTALKNKKEILNLNIWNILISSIRKVWTISILSDRRIKKEKITSVTASSSVSGEVIRFSLLKSAPF